MRRYSIRILKEVIADIMKIEKAVGFVFLPDALATGRVIRRDPIPTVFTPHSRSLELIRATTQCHSFSL